MLYRFRAHHIFRHLPFMLSTMSNILRCVPLWACGRSKNGETPQKMNGVGSPEISFGGKWVQVTITTTPRITSSLHNTSPNSRFFFSPYSFFFANNESCRATVATIEENVATTMGMSTFVSKLMPISADDIYGRRCGTHQQNLLIFYRFTTAVKRGLNKYCFLKARACHFDVDLTSSIAQLNVKMKNNIFRLTSFGVLSRQFF